MALAGKLSYPKRFITTHIEQGLSIVGSSLTEDAPFYAISGGPVEFAQCYMTKGFPIDINNDADIEVYQGFLSNAPGLTVSGGTVLRYVDMPPDSLSPMHRTVSLDYGVVLEGDMELVLDSGETRSMKRGDVCIQRGTMHAWRNCSKTEWGRMLYILQPCQSFSVGGKEAKEDYGDMQGVKTSA